MKNDTPSMQSLQFVGLMLMLNCVIFCGWWAATGKTHVKPVTVACSMGILVGVFLMLRDRVTEVSVEGLGSIKAEVEQARLDAKEIKEIKDAVISQRATVDLVARSAMEAKVQAEEAKHLVSELQNKATAAESMLKDLKSRAETTEERLSSRDITPAQASAFKTALSQAPKGRLKLRLDNPDQENSQFASKLHALLKECGYDVDPVIQPTLVLGASTGVRIGVVDGPTHPPHARPLQEAFERIGVPCPGQKFGDDTNLVWIFVGKKPF